MSGNTDRTLKTMFMKILRMLMVVVPLVCVAAGYAFWEKTLAPWWIPVGMALSIVLLTLPWAKKWSRVTLLKGKTVNLLCHVAWVGTVAYGLFISLNFWLADDASTREVTVTVLDKYMEQHEKKRKVGKHRYVSDGIRREYYLKVVFENGSAKTLHVSSSTYNKAQKGKQKTLALRKGGFGLPVITRGL